MRTRLQSRLQSTWRWLTQIRPAVDVGAPASRYLQAIHPLWMVGLGFVLGTVPALVSTDGQRQGWKQVWITSPADLLVQSLGFGVLALGAGIMLRRRGATAIAVTDEQRRRLAILAGTLFWLALFGYGVWFLSAMLHGFTPTLVWRILTADGNASYQARDAFVTIAGVTTLTQVAPVAMAAYAILDRLGQRHRWRLVLLLLLGVARLIGNSERLAVLELVIPVLIVLAAMPSRRGLHIGSRPRPAGVYFFAWATIGIIAMIALFTVSERSRSAALGKAGPQGNLLGYSLDRLLAYYATATNNGAHYWHGYSPTTNKLDVGFQWLWNFPVLGPLVARLTGTVGQDKAWEHYLTNHNNPEFNNTSAVLPLIGELGLPLALLLLFVVGLLLKRLFDGVRLGSPSALVGYASLAVCLVELPRFFYLGQGRAMPVLLACLAAKWMLNPTPAMRRWQARVAGWLPSGLRSFQVPKSEGPKSEEPKSEV